MRLEAYSAFANKKNNPVKNLKPVENSTLMGVILNTKIKNNDININNPEITNINDSDLDYTNNDEIPNKFDFKKTLKPLLYLTGVSLAGIAVLSSCFKGYSKIMNTDSGLIRPDDLPRSMNILEEQQLAAFRALRDPSKKNILGLSAVVLMSAFTLIAKNLVDGIKDVWIRKQKSDIEADFQKNMIDIETKMFSGKLKVVDNMYNSLSSKFKADNISFLGKNKNNDTDKNKDAKNIALMLLAGCSLFLGFGLMLFKNFQKTTQNLQSFMEKMTDAEIKTNIQKALEISDKQTSVDALINIFKVTNATDSKMEETLSKIDSLSNEEIIKIISSVKKDRIFASAPEALGGIREKIQYYCYINEERGYLYNWVLNPENKFNKYLFIAFCAIGSIGYLSKTIADAIKQVAVERQNSMTELNLKRNLINVEINNFKAKKEAAIKPLINNYDNNPNWSYNKKMLSAQNILNEIKNGPPYIYS